MRNYRYNGFILFHKNGWWWCDKLNPWHFTTLLVAKNWIKENGLKLK